MRIFANKKHLYPLAVGCAIFLCLGTRVQNAKAIGPSAEETEAYWRQNPKILQKTFEELFPKAESLRPLIDSFPNAFTIEKGNFYTTSYTIENACKTGSCYQTRPFGDFYMFSSSEALARLEQDIPLKKILKVLGSREFLEKVLTRAAVNHIPPCNAQKDAKTEIRFTPYFRESFFNPAGKGKLLMELTHAKDIRYDFEFAFEKQKNLVIMTEYRANYRGSNGKQTKTAKWLSKPNPLSDFPLDAVKEAKRKIPDVYKGLRDDFAAGRKKLADCKICPEVSDAVSQFISACRFSKERYASRKGKYPHTNKQEPFVPAGKYLALSDILKTEDFSEGIFGKQFWDILKHANEGSLSGEGLQVSFQIDPIPKCEYSVVEFCFQNTRVGCRNTEYCSWQGDEWNRFDFNYINFVLLFNAEKNEFSLARCANELVLNHQLIQKSETKNMLLIIDEDDQENDFALQFASSSSN